MSATDYEIAVRKWAAPKVNEQRAEEKARYGRPTGWGPVEWREITSVGFESEEAIHWSTLTGDEPATSRIVARVDQDTYELLDLIYDKPPDFAELLGSILAVEITDDDRARWEEAR